MKLQFSPSIIVHGGAGPIKDDSLPARLDGCRVAAAAGWKILENGGSALDAVETAVVVLEDNPLFNAGTGSTLNSLGEVETDAAIMAGDTLCAGAVAAVSGIKNPIRLARRVMDGRHVILQARGAPVCPPDRLSRVSPAVAHRRARKKTLGGQARHGRLRGDRFSRKTCRRNIDRRYFQ
jgi:isoaspartyl peptidase/L-asparaginase-like protein (Ntn-hydrolase superfamily)